MKFINPNKVYWVRNKDLGLNFKGGHNVIITWFDRKKNICRVKTLTSLEKVINDGKSKNIKTVYKLDALDKAKNGIITPIPIKALNAEHRSGIYNKSIIISIDSLVNDRKNLKKPKFLIKKKNKYKNE